MVIVIVFVLIAFISESNSNSNFMPNLPMISYKICGQYRTVFEKTYTCESTNLIQFNLYFSKKTFNITEMKGNLTFLVPLDDTLTLDINAASWGSIGGWKPNAMVYITKNACSNFKKVLGKVWTTLTDSFSMHINSCPIPRGTFITTFVDLKELEKHNAPKVFFYGKYKYVFKFKNGQNKILVFVLIAFLSLSNSKSHCSHNLLMGECRTVFEKIYSFKSTNAFELNKNTFNITEKKGIITLLLPVDDTLTGEYRVIFERTLSITELKGNVTFMIPLDDTLTLDVNVASWSLNGGWKPNSIVYITKNACTNMKNVLGNVWYSLIKAFNGPKTSCPFPAGTYITSGVDLKELEDHNAPKIKNAGKKVLGCAIIELNLNLK
ncbi:Uncharacterized protein FWK35_00023147, partial [Aphis craccivora]